MVNKRLYELGTNRSAIRELFEYGKQKAAQIGAENVYDFSIGNPSIPAPDCVRDAIIEAVTTMEASALHGYTSAQGDAETRAAIANYLNETYKTSFHADNFYMTCGAAASLCLTFQALTVTGEEEFLAIAPYFPEYKVFAEGAGAKLVVVPADVPDFQIDFAALEQAITVNTKGIIVNSPNNPTGSIYSDKTVTKLAALLEEKSAEYGHPIYLIADEPYREIAYDGVEVPYLTKYYKNTIVTYSYSKSLSLPGERIGYILVPDEVEGSDKLYAAICGAGRSLGYVCAPSLFQKVLVKCMGQTGDVNEYKKNRDLLYGSLTELGYECVQPQGAFYLFVKALEPDAVSFCEKAKEKNLLLVAADGFGCPGYVRVSYCVDEAMIRRSIPAFEALAAEYK